MASADEEQDNPEDHTQEAGSGGEQGNSGQGPKLKKDRNCPFCNQPFTSSSLGRHLDLYIKDKNPKAPDGIHDVDAIRRMRSGITRRHARGSSTVALNSAKRRASSIADDRADSSGGDSHELGAVFVDPNNDRRNHHTQYPSSILRRADWTATGVINNLPPRSANAPAAKRGQAWQTSETDILQSFDLESERHDNARAAVLALKEVLQTVHAATSRARQTPLFEFDPLAHNFPALVLRILTPPASLFSTTPTANETSWPLGNPPNKVQYDAIISALATRGDAMRKRRLQKIREEHSMNENDGEAANQDDNEPPGLAAAREELDKSIEREFKIYFDHFSSTYARWIGMTEARQHEIWQLELMRAVARESKARRKGEEELERERSRITGGAPTAAEADPPQHYRTAALPHEPPSPPNLTRETGLELGNIDSTTYGSWNFDRMIERWKPFVRHSRLQRHEWRTAPEDRQRAAPPQPEPSRQSQPAPDLWRRAAQAQQEIIPGPWTWQSIQTPSNSTGLGQPQRSSSANEAGLATDVRNWGTIADGRRTTRSMGGGGGRDRGDEEENDGMDVDESYE